MDRTKYSRSDEEADLALDPGYILGCGLVWGRTGDPEAGWELIDALGSPEPHIRSLAHRVLVESGEQSMGLLEEALRTGLLTSEEAGSCMTDLFYLARTSNAIAH